MVRTAIVLVDNGCKIIVVATVGIVVVVVEVTVATLVAFNIFTSLHCKMWEVLFVNSCEMGGDKGNKLAKDRSNRRSYLHRTLYFIR